VDPLANAAWHALTGPQRTVAERVGDAVRYDPEISVFAAVPDEPTADDWDALRELIGPGRATMLFREAVAVPDGWEVMMRIDGVQMRAPTWPGTQADGLVTLGADDVGEMLDLVTRTEPGPFVQRTIELGDYVGVRVDSLLVAMAGERIHTGPHRELSAICTDDAHRGKGYASQLTGELVHRIRQRGEEPILHATATNPALTLYERLGFQQTRLVEAVALKAPK
jgi:ribosomal protein S18 acetylase RimI-like enzyme